MEISMKNIKPIFKLHHILERVENDILDNLTQFVRRGSGEPQELLPFSMPWMREDP